MAEKAWYSVKSETPTRWKVTKVVEKDINKSTSYNVAQSGNELICTCFAGNKSTCRHREMVKLFQTNQAIDSGAMYQWDTKTWREATPEEEVGF